MDEKLRDQIRTALLSVRQAHKKLAALSEQQRTKLILGLAQNLKLKAKGILEANHEDLIVARKEGLATSTIDRLTLSESRLQSLGDSLEKVAVMEPALGQTLEQHQRPDGLVIKKKSIPLGVLLFIFESRPNVMLDALGLCVKSGNALILKGGKEARHTNKALGAMICETLNSYSLQDAVWILDSQDRQTVQHLLQCDGFIDLVIPRGGSSLVEYVRKNTSIPVIAHDKGLCHLYIHQDAPFDMVCELVLNSKVQRPGVCNALETLLVHRDWPLENLKKLMDSLIQVGCEMRLDPVLMAKMQRESEFSGQRQLQSATPEDWNTEHLALILNVKVVSHLKEACDHISRYGSRHTEVIATCDEKAAQDFMRQVDASCVGWNVSTRFNDGGELGLGTEIGISTSKLHAFGPMGARQLTSSRYELTGHGHIRKN